MKHKRRLAIWNFGEIAKNPNHDFALVQEHGRVRLVDVVLGQLSVFLNSFSSSVRYLLNFGRRPSQNPQKLTLAALKFGVGNVKNRRFQLGLVRFLPGFYRNTHREPLNTTTKGFGLEPQRSTGLVSRLKSVSRQYQLVGLVTIYSNRLYYAASRLRLAASRL